MQMTEKTASRNSSYISWKGKFTNTNQNKMFCITIMELVLEKLIDSKLDLKLISFHKKRMRPNLKELLPICKTMMLYIATKDK